MVLLSIYIGEDPSVLGHIDNDIICLRNFWLERQDFWIQCYKPKTFKGGKWIVGSVKSNERVVDRKCHKADKITGEMIRGKSYNQNSDTGQMFQSYYNYYCKDLWINTAIFYDCPNYRW